MKRAIRITINLIVAPIWAILFVLFYVACSIGIAVSILYEKPKFQIEIERSVRYELTFGLFKNFWK